VQIKKYLSDCTERWRGGAKSGSTILSNTYFVEHLASKRGTPPRLAHPATGNGQQD
jgi:hypothetical protein